jgi:hypothetical protein
MANLALQHTPSFLQMKKRRDETRGDRHCEHLAPEEWKHYGLPDPVRERSRWHFYRAVSQMWKSPWFTRVLIIQEHAVSRQCQLLFSKNQLTWEHFITIYALFISLNLDDPSVSAVTGPMIRHLQETREAYVKGVKRPLIDWLKSQASLTEATDPRDKIFALWSCVRRL